jgi:hypothetical protein
MTTYGGAFYWAALVAGFAALLERFGMSPIQAMQGISVSAAANQKLRTHAVPTHLVARKADDRFRPRGRRL